MFLQRRFVTGRYSTLSRTGGSTSLRKNLSIPSVYLSSTTYTRLELNGKCSHMSFDSCNGSCPLLCADVACLLQRCPGRSSKVLVHRYEHTMPFRALDHHIGTVAHLLFITLRQMQLRKHLLNFLSYICLDLLRSSNV